MKTILVVDDMAVFREPIAASLNAMGYTTRESSNGREALAELRQHQVDLMLLDLAMPSMDGIQLLKAIQTDPTLSLPPTIALTAVAERGHVLRAARLGVKQYLLKSQFSLRELRETIDRILACDENSDGTAEPRGRGGDSGEHPAAAIDTSDVGTPGTGTTPSTSSDAGSVVVEAAPQTDDAETRTVVEHTDESDKQGITVVEGELPDDPVEALKVLKPVAKRSDVRERLENRSDLKAFSPTVTKLLALTANENSSIEQITRTIKQDHSLALKILKLANSAVYTRGDPVDSIAKGVMRIGMAQIRQAVLNVGVVEQFSSTIVGNKVDAAEFWEHSIACGLIAAEITHKLDPDMADLAFTMGLVHDVGRILLANEFPEEYEQAFKLASQLGVPLEQVENRLFMMSHADCMDRLLHQWKFPKELIDPIVFHHLSIGNIRQMAPRRLPQVAALALADRLSHALLLGTSGNDVLYPTEEFCQALKIDEKVIHHIEENTQEEATNLKLTMLASGARSGAFEDQQAALRERIGQPIRILFAGHAPVFDAYRIFCDQITDRTLDTPNIAVVHINNIRDAEQVLKSLLRDEQQANVEPLPVILLSQKKKLGAIESLLKDRPVQRLGSPVRIDRLVDALRTAISDEAIPRAVAA